ncbi:hypothetical protein L0128_15765 [candidate division KSB1 bacterium]|nr:hypothetical protein [candidate division KSB1 bacterium]
MHAPREHYQRLLMGAIDQELTPSELAEFNQLLNQNPEFQAEWQKHQKLKEVLKVMKFKSPPAEVWDSYWLNIYNKIERGIAWIAISIGTIILMTYGLYQALTALLADQNLGLIKYAILAVILGFVILLVSVIREKVMLQKQERYQEVQR